MSVRQFVSSQFVSGCGLTVARYMSKKDKKDSALRVSGGVSQPSSVNEHAVENFKRSRKQLPSVDDFFTGIKKGNRAMLSQAITLIESALPEHQALSQELIKRCLPLSGKSVRIGITGIPGAGKSTFIESFGSYLTGLGHRLAVLAIDPSSERSGGSILGDKTRMEALSSDQNAFIRPSPSSGTTGGVARKTRESIILCEAAGFDIIIVETVGVGQSETAVHSMVDFFLLLMIPGAGDELQGMKRGIMEMADMIVINKADGDSIALARKAKTEYNNALHLFPLPPSGWAPKVLSCSSLENRGIDKIWEEIGAYKSHATSTSYFKIRRSGQASYWMYQTLQEGLTQRFFSYPEVKERLDELEQMIDKDEVTSFGAATELLEKYFPDHPVE